MIVPVVWLNFNDEAIARGYWDQQLLEDLFSRDLWQPAGGITFAHHSILDPSWALPPGRGAVFVVPARHNVGNVEQLNKAIASYEWVVVIGTGDEEAVFDWSEVSHRRRKVWAMGARPDHRAGVDRPLGSGYGLGFRQRISAQSKGTPGRLDLFFCGQVTHPRREQAVKAIENAVPAWERLTVPTRQFLADGNTESGGLTHTEYARQLADTKVAPCPSGPESPDSFRLYEALEAGVVPVADGRTPAGRVPGYWPFVFGEPPHFPVADQWTELPGIVEEVKAQWPAPASRISAWWTGWKRRLAYALDDDIRELAEEAPVFENPNDQITVIIPTCPINANPDTAIIVEVVESVRTQLPTAEILIVCDGVRPGMEHKTADYEEFLLRLTRLCQGWRNVLPIILPEWGHQAGGTRAALEQVKTPLILFVEHDTPVVGEIDWPGLCGIVLSGEVGMVRLHHETAIGSYHLHMMLDDAVPRRFGGTDATPSGVPLLRTFQWSQRPHLATTKFYRERVMPYFGRESRTYIEWIMHGAVQHGIEKGIEACWDRWRVAVYYPDGGNIQRSTHLDGRAGASIDDAVWAYDGEPPPGAPPPTPPKRVKA